MARAFSNGLIDDIDDLMDESHIFDNDSSDSVTTKLMITILPKSSQLKSNVYSKTMCFNNTQKERLTSQSITVNNLLKCNLNTVPAHLKVLIPDKFLVTDDVILCAEMLTLIANDKLTAAYFTTQIFEKMKILKLLKSESILNSLCSTFCHRIPHCAEEFRLALEKLDPQLLAQFIDTFNVAFQTNLVFKTSYIKDGKLLSDFAKRAHNMSDETLEYMKLNRQDAKNIRTLMYNNLSVIAKNKIQELEFITNSNSSRLIHCCVLCAKSFEKLDLLIYNTPCCNITTHIECSHIFESKCTICDTIFCKLNEECTKMIRSIRAVKANEKRTLFVENCETHHDCYKYKHEGVNIHFDQQEFIASQSAEFVQLKLEHHVSNGNYRKGQNYNKRLADILIEFNEK